MIDLRKLLIKEEPLQVLPSLATAIGLNEALFLQQLHYWLSTSSHIHDGKYWIYNTLDQWLEQFPFWSKRTLCRITANLKTRGLIETTDIYNKSNSDRKLWYTINYQVVERLFPDTESADRDAPHMMGFGAKLLLPEHPLQFKPSLAVEVGLNGAIFLQQLHYWLKRSQHIHEDQRWVYKTLDQWHEDFPFWSKNTVHNIIRRLRAASLIISTDRYNSNIFDRKLWYTIHYQTATELEAVQVSVSEIPSEITNVATPQNEASTTEITNVAMPEITNVATPVTNVATPEITNVATSIYRTETTTETTNRDYAETTTTETATRDRARVGEPGPVVVVFPSPTIIDQLNHHGIAETMTAKICDKFDDAYIQAKIDLLESNIDNGIDIKSPSGYLVQAIYENYQTSGYTKKDLNEMTEEERREKYIPDKYKDIIRG